MAPAKGATTARAHERSARPVVPGVIESHAAYKLSAQYSSQNGAMSHVLMTSKPPRDSAASPCVDHDRNVAPRDTAWTAATETTRISNGRAMKCGCRSAQSAEKNGNSLMPSGCKLGITRDALNHHRKLLGGQTPWTMPWPKFLI